LGRRLIFQVRVKKLTTKSMRLCLIFIMLFFFLVLTVVNAQGLTGRLEQGDYERVVQSLKEGVNTFGFQPNMGQVGDFEGRMRAGMHSVEFRGDGLSSGIYFYRLEAGNFVSVKKMVLVK
jgi:hypothetical protein